MLKYNCRYLRLYCLFLHGVVYLYDCVPLFHLLFLAIGYCYWGDIRLNDWLQLNEVKLLYFLGATFNNKDYRQLNISVILFKTSKHSLDGKVTKCLRSRVKCSCNRPTSNLLSESSSQYLPMELTINKQSLPIALSQLLIRHSARFFQRLVLLEPEDDQNHTVKHYDHQCEGVEMLVGFFKTKQQNALLRAFISVKEYSHATITATISAPVTQRCAKGSTTRTDLKSLYTGSQYSPIGAHPLHTFRSTGDALSKQSMGREKSADLETLLMKVKEVNSRHDNSYSFQGGFSRNYLGENSSYCLNKGQRSHANLYTNHSLLQPNSSRLTELFKGQPCSSHSVYSGQSSYRQLEPSYGGCRGDQNQFDSSMLQKKKDRRDLILRKFQRIEEGLGELGHSKKARSRLNNDIMKQIDNIKQRLKLRL